jgi:hypothetical protein
MLDDQGAPIRYADDTLAYAIYTMTVDAGGGVIIEAVGRIQIWAVSPGVSIAALFDTTLEEYQANPAVFDAVIDGVSVTGEVLPNPETGADTIKEPGLAATLQAPASGEPAPVVVNGQWRFAVASATAGAEIPSLELEAKEGREWVVVFADVTNWSTAAATFSLRDPLVQTAEMTEPWDIAPSSTRQVARLLELTEQGNEAAEIPASATVRLVLVYSIPAGGTGMQLLIGESALLLDDYLDLAFDPAGLPPVPQPPELVEGIVTNISVNSAGALTVTVDSSTEEHTLIGADLPSGSDCYAEQALAAIVPLIGAQAMVESDPAVEGGSNVYLWIVRPGGVRTMLNNELVASGAARLLALPNTARFAAWLQSSEAAAQASGAGLWATCGA